MNVLVIPEDFTKDQYMLKPIIKAMMAQIGRPQAKVQVCQDPNLGGISQALNWNQIELILNRYRQIDLFLLCVDRDGDANRRHSLDQLEEKATSLLNPEKTFIAEHAWQEIEVWVLAGLKKFLKNGLVWQDVRNNIDPKENYYLPFAQQCGVAGRLGEGRKTLGLEAANNYKRIRKLCDEVADLEFRIRTWLKQ